MSHLLLQATARRSCTTEVLLVTVGLLLTSGCSRLNKPDEQNADRARELSYRGLDAMQREDWSRAEHFFGEAVLRSPSDERAQAHYADTLWRRGATDKAISHMEKAVELSGSDSELIVQLGEMYLSTGRTALAAAQADEAIRANRQSAKAWALQGDVYAHQQNWPAALASYHRAIGLQEHMPPVQLAIAEIYDQTKRPRRSLATLQSLTDQYPSGKTPTNVIYRHALALKSLGRYDDAVEMLADASQSEQAHADLLYELSEAQFFLGDAANAHLSVLAALARDPNHVASHELKTAIEEQQSGFTAAAERPLR